MTANIDGESNLKMRQTPTDKLFGRTHFLRRLRSMVCNVACDLPNDRLDKFR